jgi:hypothetical protein
MELVEDRDVCFVNPMERMIWNKTMDDLQATVDPHLALFYSMWKNEAAGGTRSHKRAFRPRKISLRNINK